MTETDTTIDPEVSMNNDDNQIKDMNAAIEEVHLANESLALIFIFFVLLLGGIVRIMSKKYRLPFTPVVFLLGLAITQFSLLFGIFQDSITRISQIDPNGLLQIFLPILLFNGSFNLDWHIFRREIKQITLMGFPGVIVNALLITLSLKLFLYTDDEKYTWISAFMFGALISCTDPIAIINVLRELPSSKKFNVLLEGESLLNDAIGMILYQIALVFFKEAGHTVWYILYTFLTLSLGGIILGVLSGVFSSLIIQKLFNDEILVVNTTLMSSYIVYFIAEGSNFLGFQISGIMAVISCGLFMSAVGKTKINTNSDYAVYTFWNFLVYASETIIFFLAGLIVGESVWNQERFVTGVDYYKMLILYAFLNGIRLLMLLMSYPLLRKHGYGLTIEELQCLAVGGLKGGISIAFAMLVANDETLKAPLREIFFFDVAGCSVLTLTLNSSFLGYLIKKTKLLQTNKIKNHVFKNFLENLLCDLEGKIEELKNNQYLQVADWEQVKELSGLFEIHHNIYDLDKENRSLSNATLIRKDSAMPELELEMSLLNESKISINFENRDVAENEIPLLAECRNRMIMSLKGFYYELFKKNQCSGDAFLILIESANWDLDNDHTPMNAWTVINNSFYKPRYVKAVMELQNISCIGGLIKHLVFTHVAHAYDVTSCFVEAQRNAENLTRKFPLSERYVKIIKAEVEENRKKAEEYIYSYLEVSFPEITRSIQTKRAAYNILQYERSLLDQKYLMGQIDEKEYSLIVNRIDNKMIKLGSYNPEWIRVPLKKLMLNIPFFSYIPQQTIDQLISSSQETMFERDAPITRIGEKAASIYIITRGGGTEFCHDDNSTYREKKGVGSVISFHQLVTKNPNYEATFVSDSIINVAVFPIDSMKQLVARNIDHEAFAWRESLYALSRIHCNELRPLGSLERQDLLKLWSYCAFRKYEIGECLNLHKGGILLDGSIKTYEKEAYDEIISGFNKKILDLNLNEIITKKERENDKRKLTQTFLADISRFDKCKSYDNYNFFEPLNNQFDFVVMKPITIFEFTAIDEVRAIFNKDSNEINYSHLLAKKEEVSIVQKELDESQDDLSKKDLN